MSQLHGSLEHARDDEGPAPTAVRRVHVATLITARLVVSTLLLGSAILLQVREPGVFPVDPLFWLVGAIYGLSVVYVAGLRYVERWPWLVDAQLALDAVLVSAFIYVTGGITSYFSWLYMMPVITASTIRMRAGGLRVAALSAVLYVGVALAQFADMTLITGWQPVSVELPSPQIAQYTLGINLSGFFLVAFLAGSLAEKVRSAGVRLEDASVTVRDLRAFNQLVIDSLKSGLITTDIDCRIITINRGARAIIGLDSRRDVGRDACEVLQLPPTFRSSLRSVNHQGNVRIDVEHITTDRRQIELGVAASHLTLPGGRTGYLFTFQDVTVIRRQARDAHRQQQLAAVGQMAAGIAHEIRNPLASMSGSMQILRSELPLNDEQAQLMDIVLRESERLNATIRSFLDYARPRRPTMARFDAGRLVRDTVLMLRNSPDVGAPHVVEAVVPATPVWLDGDEHYVRQIVWNLATNGIRAMPDGGRLCVAVDAETSASGDSLIALRVRDTGCGIPADQIDRIFEPFRSSFAKGSGLGMAIVHRVVTDCGGTIDVSSAVGTGTEVVVRLPKGGVSGAADETEDAMAVAI